MAQILIRNVDEGVRRAFKAALAERGETMQEYLTRLVEISARGIDVPYVLDQSLAVARNVAQVGKPLGTAAALEIAQAIISQLSKMQEG